MGVIYKLRDEVVQFIISQHGANPLLSCRQLAESASAKFGLHLSKSSVHDVLKESGVIMPRGRKPKDKFSIPLEKKKQIQDSLSQIKLLPAPEPVLQISSTLSTPGVDKVPGPSLVISPEYEGAGNVFLNAARWEMGNFSDKEIKETERGYYLTYVKGIKIVLENGQEIFIDFPVPIERCIREIADGLINNVRPFIASLISDEALFRSLMNAEGQVKMTSVEIVDRKDRILAIFKDIVDYKRNFIVSSVCYVENSENNVYQRSMGLFFPQVSDIEYFRENCLQLKGFDTHFSYIKTTTIVVPNTCDNISKLETAAQQLNNMFLFDPEGHLINVKIQQNLN